MVIKLPTVFLQIQWSSEKTNPIQMWISVITDTIFFTTHFLVCSGQHELPWTLLLSTLFYVCLPVYAPGEEIK